MNVRTRYAPSPTGYQHAGNIRTGLFAWLTARHAGGQFILRLENTDKSREVAGAVDHLLECLDTLGLNRDEGIDVGGPHAPYTQSERLEIYRAWAQKLIDAGRAYADPYTPEQVQSFRQQAQSAKKPFLYRNHRPDNPPAWDGSQPLRFKSDPKNYHWHDEVMGDLSTGPEVVDDFILIKSDGFPTYNFAHIVDDAEMEISHVIRGQEYISSMPNYLNLYEALELTPPIFATMPHILNEQGNKKLSKRDGAKDVLEYIREGYLPEALLSFIATLGWNDGTTQEIFSRDELIEKFSLDRVQRSGAKFDEKRLSWINGSVIRSLSIDQLAERAEDYWAEPAKQADPSHKKAVLELVKDRLKTMDELWSLAGFFFEEPNPKATAELLSSSGVEKDELRRLLAAAAENLGQSDFSYDDIKARLNGLLESLSTKPKALFSAIRIAISGAPASPELFGSLQLLGKEKTIARLNKALALLD